MAGVSFMSIPLCVSGQLPLSLIDLLSDHLTVGHRGFIRLRETTFILTISSHGGGVLVMPDTQERVILREKD